jgi:hypothetical protein
MNVQVACTYLFTKDERLTCMYDRRLRAVAGLAWWLLVIGRRHAGDTPWRVLDQLTWIVIIARRVRCAL